MLLIFPRVPIIFTCQVLSIHPENENTVYQLFGNDVIFHHRMSWCPIIIGHQSIDNCNSR